MNETEKSINDITDEEFELVKLKAHSSTLWDVSKKIARAVGADNVPYYSYYANVEKNLDILISHYLKMKSMEDHMKNFKPTYDEEK